MTSECGPWKDGGLFRRRSYFDRGDPRKISGQAPFFWQCMVRGVLKFFADVTGDMHWNGGAPALCRM